MRPRDRARLKKRKNISTNCLLRVYFNRNRQTVSKTTHGCLRVFFSFIFFHRHRCHRSHSKHHLNFQKKSLPKSDAHRIHNLYKRSLIKFNKLCVPFCCLAMSCVVMHVKYIYTSRICVSAMCSIFLFFSFPQSYIVTINKCMLDYTCEFMCIYVWKTSIHLLVYRNIYSISAWNRATWMFLLNFAQVDSSASHHHHPIIGVQNKIYQMDERACICCKIYINKYCCRCVHT